MFSESGKAEFDHLLPLLHSVPRDPMLHMVLEGNRPGRIFVHPHFFHLNLAEHFASYLGLYR